MSLWDKVLSVFGQKQNVTIVDSESCEVNQAGRDLTINKYYGLPMSNMLLTYFVQEKARDIRKLLDEGHIAAAEIELSKVVTADGFSILEAPKKGEYYYLGGLIGLRKDQTEVVRHQINQLNTIGDIGKANQLAAHLAIVLDDYIALNQALSKLSHSVSDEDCDVFRAAFHTARQESDLAISVLTVEDTIKVSLAGNSDARLYLGLAYLQKCEYELSAKEFEEAYKGKPTPYTKYLLTLAKLNRITNRPGILFSLTDGERQEIIECISALHDVEGFFVEQPLEQKAEFWANRLSVTLILDPLQTKHDILSLPIEIQVDYKLQLVLGDAYFLSDEYDKAEPVFASLYQQNKIPEILMKQVVSMFEQDKHLEILGLLSKVPLSHFDARGITSSIYINSFAKHNDYVETKQLIHVLLNDFRNSPSFLESSALIAFQNQDVEWATSLIHCAIDKVTNNEPSLIRLSISNSCVKMGLMADAINVLRPLASSFEVAKRRFIQLLLSAEQENELAEAEVLLDDAIRNGVEDSFYYTLRADIYVKDERFYEAYVMSDKAFDLEQTVQFAYNAAVSYIRSGNTKYDLLEKYIPTLQSSLESLAVSLHARLQHLCGRPGAKETIYKALHWLGEDFHESVYYEYIWLCSPTASHIKIDEKVNFDYIQEDAVVILADDLGFNRSICFDGDSSIIRSEGEKSFGCEHYSSKSTLFILLRGRKILSKVAVEGKNYTIQECINKYAYAYRHCLNRFNVERPASPHIQAVQISNNDPVTSLIPYLERARKADEYILQQYNFSKGKLVSLLAIGNGILERYVDGIIKLLNLEGQSFFAGIPASLLHLRVPVVITLSSVVILSLMRRLHIIRSIPDLMVPEALILEIDSVINATNISNVHAGGSVGLADDGSVIYYQNTEEQNQNRLTFWQDIRAELSNCNIVQNVPKLPVKTMHNMLSSDLDAISLAASQNGILICDDSSIRTLATYWNNTLNTNSSSVIHMLCNLEDKLETLVTLTKAKYLYCILESDLLLLFNQVIEEPILFGEGTRVAKLQTIIQNLCQPDLFKVYFPVFRGVIFSLLLNQIRTPAMEKVIILLIDEMRKVVLSTKKISEEELLALLLEPCGLDVIRERTITSLYKQSKEGLPVVTE